LSSPTTVAFFYAASSRSNPSGELIEPQIPIEAIKRVRHGDPVAYGTYDLISRKLDIRYCGLLKESLDGL
jgi:hypothetical protein